MPARKRRGLKRKADEAEGDEAGENTRTTAKKVPRAVAKKDARKPTVGEGAQRAQEHMPYLTGLQALTQDPATTTFQGDKSVGMMKARGAMSVAMEERRARMEDEARKPKEYSKERMPLLSGRRNIAQDSAPMFEMQPSQAYNRARNSRPSVQQSFGNDGLMYPPLPAHSGRPAMMQAQPQSDRYVLAGLHYPPLPRREVVGQQLRPLPRGPPPMYLPPPPSHGRLPQAPARAIGLERNPFADLDVSFLNRPTSAHRNPQAPSSLQALALPRPVDSSYMPNSAGLDRLGGSFHPPISLSPVRPGSSHNPPISVSPVRPGPSHHTPTFPLPHGLRGSYRRHGTMSNSPFGRDERLPRRVVTAPSDFDNLRLAPILYPNPLIKKD